MRGANVSGNIPGLECVECPLCIFIFMALVAGIRYAEFKREPGFRNPKAVVVPVVNNHVGLDRHVAIHTGSTRPALFMPVMFRAVIRRVYVALGTKLVVIRPYSVAVGIMAIGANDTCLVHLALQERTIHINFVIDLPIRKIQAGFEWRKAVLIVERSTGVKLGQLTTPGMAGCTGLDLHRGSIAIQA